MDDENDNQSMTPQPGAGGPAPTVTSEPLPAEESKPPTMVVPEVESKPLADTAPMKEQFPPAAAQPTEDTVTIPEKAAPAAEPEKAAASSFQDKIEQYRQAGFSNQEISEYSAQLGGKYLAAGFTQEEVNDYMGIKSPDMSGVQGMIKQNLDQEITGGDGEAKSQVVLGFPKLLDTAFGMPVTDILKGGSAAKSDVPLPAALRGHLMDAYEKGTAVDAGDFMQQAIPAAVKTAHPTHQQALDSYYENPLASEKTTDPLTAARLGISNSAPDNGLQKADIESYKQAWETLKSLTQKDTWTQSWFRVSDETKQAALKAKSEGKGFREVYEPAMSEAVMNSPVGGAFKLMGGVPVLAEVGTLLNKVGIPKTAEASAKFGEFLEKNGVSGAADALRVTPDELQAVLIALGGKAGLKKLNEATTSRYTTYHDVPKEATAKPIEPNAPSEAEVSNAVKSAGPAFKNKAPTVHDFNDAAYLLFGRDGEVSGSKTLRTVYKETGVKPSQALEDAKSNPEIARNLVAGEVPRAYENLKEPAPNPNITPAAASLLRDVDAGGVPFSITNGIRKIAKENDIEITKDMRPDDVIQAIRNKSAGEPIPPEGVQYSDLDPTSDMFEFEKELAAEHGIELQVRPKAATEASAAPEPAPLSEAPPAPTTVEKAATAAPAPTVNATLPRDLAGAKPRYNYGSKGFTLKFDSDVDRAAFITSQKTKSKADAKYRKFLTDNGYSDAAIDKLGADVRAHIKSLAKDGEPGELLIEAQAATRFAEENPQSYGHNSGEIPQENPLQGEHTDKEFAEFAKDYPQTNIGTEEAADKWIEQKGSATGNEHGVLTNVNKGTAIKAWTDNQKGELSIDTSLLSDPNNPVKLIHYHPEGYALSPKDIKNLASNAGLIQNGTRGGRGNISFAKLTPVAEEAFSKMSKGEIESLMDTLDLHSNDSAFSYLQKLVSDAKISIARAGDLEADLVNRILHKAGIIDYASSYRTHTLPDIDKVIDESAKELYNIVQGKKSFQDANYANDPLRNPPLILRAEEGIRGFYKADAGHESARGTRDTNGETSTGTTGIESFEEKPPGAYKSPEEIVNSMRGDPAEFQRYTAARHALSESLRGKKPTMPLDEAREIVSMDRWKYEPIFKELRRQEEASRPREELSKEGKSTSINPLAKILNPAAISESARDMATSLRQAKGPAAQATAVIQDSLHKYAKDINKLTDAERLQLIDYMESRTQGAKVPNPKLQEVADKIRNIYAQMAVKIQEVFPDVGLRQDYFTHQYKDKAAADKFFSDWIAKQGSERNLRQRAFPTLKEAMEAGLEPKTTNPIETVMTYVNNMNNLISTHEAVRLARENGIAEYFKKGQQPEGWEPLKGNLAEKDGKGLYAPEDAARVYNNDVSEKVTGPAGEIIDNVQRGANFATKLVLSFSGYHATATTMASMAKDVSRAVFGGTAKERAADLLSAVTPLKNTIEGGKIAEAYLGRGELPPGMQKALDLAVKNNTVNIKQQDYWKAGPAKDFVDAFKTGTLLTDAKAAGEKMITGRTLKENPLTGTVKVIASGLGKTMDTVAKPLFDYYIPRIKLSANIKELHDWIEQHPKATEKELDRAAQDIGNNVDNTFGEMMRDNLFWHQITRQTLQTTFLSYSWITGGARMLKGIPDVGATLIGKKGLTSNAKYLFGMAMTYAVVNGVRSYLGTGQAPDDWKDFVYPRTGGKTAQGKPEREILPSHIGQYTNYLHEGLGAAGNELSPGLKLLYNLVTNKDFRGLPVTNANNSWFDSQRWGDYGKYVLNEASPLTIKNFLQGQKKRSKMSDFEMAVGARRAPQFITDPKGYEAMMTKVHNREYKKKIRSDEKLKAQYESNDSEE